MKLQYKHQAFQRDAAQAVVEVFGGQPHYILHLLRSSIHVSLESQRIVAETKGAESIAQLRGVELAKIECATRHFEAISQNIHVAYGVAKDYKTLCDKIMK